MKNPRIAKGISFLLLIGILGAVHTNAQRAQPISNYARSGISSRNGAPTSRIIVAPNVRVSRDRTLAFAEMYIAAHPTDPNILFGGSANYFRWQNGDHQCRGFASRDGGYTWDDTDPPLRNRGNCDSWVAFGKMGTVLYASFDDVSRSDDSGLTWGTPAKVDADIDAEMLFVDHVSPRFSGRMYIGFRGGKKCKEKNIEQGGRKNDNYVLCVARSEDDGRTWKEPVVIVNPESEPESNRNHPMPQIFSDGTLFVPYFSWGGKGTESDRLWYTTSRDGGVKFDPPKRIITQSGNYLYQDSLGSTRLPITVDSRSSQYRDRLYMVVRKGIEQRGPGRDNRLYLSVSSDRGVSWSEPRLIDPTAAQDSMSWQPRIAVSHAGVVGISWFDATRDAKRPGDYNEYFAASIDGGASFLPATRVSSATSNLLDASNALMQTYPTSDGSISIRRGTWGLAGGGYYSIGGHYVGMAVDAAGVFHPFWPDTRDDGSYQIYTTRIRVEPVGEARPVLEQQVVSSSVEFKFGRGHFDQSTKVWELPVRILNKGATPLYGPVTVSIADITPPTRSGFLPFDAKIVNSTNGIDGKGAVFDFTPYLGSIQRLFPGEQSGEFIWKLRPNVPDTVGRTDPIILKPEVKAMVEKKSGPKN